MRIVVLCVLISQFAALAQSESVSGSFNVEGSITWFEPGNYESTLYAGYGDSSTTHDLLLTSKHVIVHRFEKRYFEVDGREVTLATQTEIQKASFSLTNVRMAQANENSAGWLGIYAAPESAVLFTESNGPSLSESRSVTTLGDSSPDFDFEPRSETYSRTITGKHIYISTPGSFTLEGKFMLKIRGLDLLVRARENTTTYETGDELSSDGTIRERTIRWLFLEIENGKLTFDSRSDFEFAAASVDASWDGRVVFNSLSGELTSDEARYASTRHSNLVTGRFDAKLLPSRDSRANTTLMAVNGDLAQTNLFVTRDEPRAMQAVTSSPVGVNLALVLALVAVSGVATGAVVSRARARHSRPDSTIEACMAFADLAIEAGDHARAVDWLRRARVIAPKSERLCREEAHYLGLLGRVDDALTVLATAHRLRPTGEAAFQAVELLLRQTEDLARAESWLVTTFDVDPGFLVHVEDNDMFRRLAGRPRFEAACAKARGRLDASTSDAIRA